MEASNELGGSSVRPNPSSILEIMFKSHHKATCEREEKINDA